MKTSLSELVEIDRFIDDEMETGERFLFESRQQLDTELRVSVTVQKQVRRLVTLQGKSKLRESLDELHRVYFTDTAHLIFREKILSYFR
jgi:hypothetical protein